MLAAPYAVELLHGGVYQGRVIGEDSGFEVATVAALHAYSGASQIGGTYVSGLKVKYKYLEVDSRT